MKNHILIVASLLALSACDVDTRTPEQRQEQYDVELKGKWDAKLQATKGLEDCEYHKVTVEYWSLDVIRCPHSTTQTVHAAKIPVKTTVDSE